MIREWEFLKIGKKYKVERKRKLPVKDGLSIQHSNKTFKVSSDPPGCDMLLLDSGYLYQILQGWKPLAIGKRLLGEKLNIDWKIALLTIVSTIFITLDYYSSLTGYNHFDNILYYVLIPGLITMVVFRESPRDYGFRLGDWKTGLLLTLLGCILMLPVIWYLGSRNSSMVNYYGFPREGLIWKKGLEMFGWEYIFRGWLLFGYAKKYGSDALWLQAVPFAIAHLGKPSVETLSTIFGGFAFGWVAWRTGSFLYGFLIHWFIGVLIVILSSGAIA